MLRPSLPLSFGLLLLRLQSTAGLVHRDVHGETTGPARQLSHESFAVELSEIQQIRDYSARGEFARSSVYTIRDRFGGVDPVDADCPASDQCVGALTRDGSLELDSRYGCTEPFGSNPDDSRDARETCGVLYRLAFSNEEKLKIASVKIALHPDSITTFTVEENPGLVSAQTVVEEWEAAPGTTELQEIPGLEGVKLWNFMIMGIMEAGEYLAILEVEIYVTVNEVPVVGTSASTRTSISATATTDASSAMNTLDGDATDSSSWTCSSGEVCEITYDLQATESLEQLRIAFSEASDAGGQLNFLAAGESGVYSTVRSGIQAGGRSLGADGLQTFGGVRALARYVKIEAVPTTGGSIVINEVEFRVGDIAPVRRVAEKKWLKPTGPLPLGDDSNYDVRRASEGGCDPPKHFEGCHVYYMKDGDMESRWTCGPLAGPFSWIDCDVEISLIHFRYVRQIQIAFHLGDEQHDEFSIEAKTAQGWMTVVASAISSGDSADYQTFDVGVHAVALKVVPKFQRVNQWFSVKEMVILETSNKAFIAGILPVFKFVEFNHGDDAAPGNEVPTRFSFDISDINDTRRIEVGRSTVTAVKMRFPADREFVFEFSYFTDSPSGGRNEVIERFISAGGDNELETFTLSEPSTMLYSIVIIAVSGPTFANVPDYPALRVVDFQVVGEALDSGPGYFKMVTAAMTEWGSIPDIIGDGVSDQQYIMTAICETKGATFDGTDCVGELDDSTVYISLSRGDYFMDGPIFVKSGVTIDGSYSDDPPVNPFFYLYEGANNRNTAEDAMVVIDGVTDANLSRFQLLHKAEPEGDIVPGTVGNLCLDVRNSKGIELDFIWPDACRIGAAHFTDSSNINIFAFYWSSISHAGNFMELTRVDDFYASSYPDMNGLLMDTCNNIVWDGFSDEGTTPTGGHDPPFGGNQTASVVITGDSSGIVFRRSTIGNGSEPRILMESTMPITLDNMRNYLEAESGDCIIGVPEGSADDLVVQVNVGDQTLSKSGDCWVFD